MFFFFKKKKKKKKKKKNQRNFFLEEGAIFHWDVHELIDCITIRIDCIFYELKIQKDEHFYKLQLFLVTIEISKIKFFSF